MYLVRPCMLVKNLLPCGSAGKESTCNVGRSGFDPWVGKIPREGKGTHSGILSWRIPWTVIVHGVAKSWT